MVAMIIIEMVKIKKIKVIKKINGWRDDFPPCNNRTSWAQDLLYDLNQLVELYGDVEGQAGYGGSW